MRAEVAMPPAPPIVLCLLLCDGVHTDPVTQKRYLLGTLSEVQLAATEGLHRELWLLTELTNGHGRTPLGVQMVRSDPRHLDGQELLALQFEVDFPDPRDVVSIALRLGRVFLGELGEYRVILRCQDRTLLERRFDVRRWPEAGSPEAGSPEAGS